MVDVELGEAELSGTVGFGVEAAVEGCVANRRCFESENLRFTFLVNVNLVLISYAFALSLGGVQASNDPA